MIQQDRITNLTNSMAFFGTYVIAAFGALLIFVGLYNVWIGDTEGFIIFIPGLVLFIIGLVFNKLHRKWH